MYKPGFREVFPSPLREDVDFNLTGDGAAPVGPSGRVAVMSRTAPPAAERKGAKKQQIEVSRGRAAAAAAGGGRAPCSFYSCQIFEKIAQDKERTNRNRNNRVIVVRVLYRTRIVSTYLHVELMPTPLESYTDIGSFRTKYYVL